MAVNLPLTSGGLVGGGSGSCSGKAADAPVAASVLERFWAKVERVESSECWLWLACQDGKGYGLFWVGRYVRAHRFAYELLVGPIPEGLQLDHLCRVRHCVNPAHLEPVTNRENVLRGEGLPAQAARKTHCPHGHPYDEANTLGRSDGSRVCRTCNRAWCAAYARRRLAAVRGAP